MSEAEKSEKGRGAYLPVLPDGWTYEVRATGPGGRVAVLKEAIPADWYVDFIDGADTRRARGATLAEGLRVLGRGVRAIVRVDREEAAAKAAREEALAALGESVPPRGDDPWAEK